jgi:hypothetical protein
VKKAAPNLAVQRMRLRRIADIRVRRLRALPMNTVNTPQGEVQLLPPPVELLRAIRSFLPFGAFRYETPQNGAK